MLFYFILFLSFFLVALIIRLYGFVFFDLAQNSVGLVNELLSEYDEDTKIEKVQKTTNSLLYSFLKILLLFVVAFAAGSVPVFAYVFFSGTGLNELDFSSFYPILSISIGASLAFFIPVGKKKEGEYSELSKLLHRMALDNYKISDKLFKRETKKISKRKQSVREDFVIVSGLARAGTTSLMNDLARLDEFVSLSYANMPFLLCPNLWSKFYKPKKSQVKERSHKDGIMIGLNSNEALEEYFFKVKAEDSFIHDKYLTEYEISKENYNDYLNYQRIVKLDDGKIYLAKNNNFILRYKSVREYNNNFLMVILFRDPLTHAASLMEKHQSYSKLQQEDPFVLEYMNWLGHHEFGLNQKPFIFNSSNKAFLTGDKSSLDFWLQSWINFYRYVLDIQHPNTMLVNYSSFCENPSAIIAAITEKVGIKTSLPEYSSFKNKRKIEAETSKEVLEEAEEIYGRLQDLV